LRHRPAELPSQGDIVLKKLFILVALASVAGIAVAATPGSDVANPAETKASPHGGMLTTPGAALPPGHPETSSADIQLANSGKVLDVLDSDTYTYLQVTTEKGPLWLAAYKTAVGKGATVKYSNGIVMSRFYSKSLNRTFDLIVFVDRLEVAK
jgi:hypothetical protein